MTPVFFNFRMRLYIGFVLSECSCIMAGLGAYPTYQEAKPGQGPSKPVELDREVDIEDDIDFETIHNIDELKTESVTTMREALKTWNMTVQWWLVANVYRRVPGSRDFRAFVVMMVSSIWHGIYTGYYLSLGSVPFVLAVEDLYEKILRKRLPNTESYDFVAWFMRFQWFSYLGMGFQLLSIDKTMTFWSSVYYIGHLILPIFYLMGIFIVKPLAKLIWPSTIEAKDK